MAGCRSEARRARGCGGDLGLYLACALALGVNVASADELKPFTASYAWIWHGMTVAVSHVELQKGEGDLWSYRSRSEPRGIGRVFSERPTQLSVVRVTASGTQPLSYNASDGTSSTKRAIDVKYDWDKDRVTGVYENTPIDLPLRPDLQDDASVQVALMAKLLRGQQPDRFLLLNSKNDMREYSYIREGETVLDTPIGKIPTIIYRSERQWSSRVNRYWCAPDRGYIPLRVQQKVDDDVQWTMEILSLTRQ